MRNKTGSYDALIEIMINKRKELKLTQSQMADKLNIKRRTYQRWETGNLTLSQFADVCNRLELVILVIPECLLKNVL